ncbi:MAG: MerR family transcriptional regulator [Stellaceae bacterium]
MDQVDADAAARAAGVPVGTINVWIQRRLLPGVEVGSRGKSRSFSVDDVLHLAVMAALVRIGIASPLASAAAELCRRDNNWRKLNAVLTIGPSDDTRLGGPVYEQYVVSGEALRPEQWLSGFYKRPEGYVTVELFRLVKRVEDFLAAETAKADAPPTATKDNTER